VAIARALGERPERVFRMAGLLPALPRNEEEEKEAIALLRRLSPEMRTVALNILQSMLPDRQPPQIQLAEPPAAYHLDSIDEEILNFLIEFPELHDLIRVAKQKLSEQSLRALLYNIRIFASNAAERDEFKQLHMQLSELFSRLDLE